jgi:predicted phosphodiesterase
VRTALVADTHGNAVGLQAVLADLEREPVDQVVCLGDIAQGGAQPAECLDRMRELGSTFVLGNSDAFLLSVEAAANSAEPVTEGHLETRDWTLRQLDDSHLEFMQSFRKTASAELGGGKSMLAFHGSPRSFDEVLLPETPDVEFARALGPPDSALFAGAHVHFQWLRRYGPSLFLNPGSAGLAYDRAQPEDGFRFDAWAEYAVVSVEDGRLGIEFRRVPFDAQEVARATLQSGMPYAERRAGEWGVEA